MPRTRVMKVAVDNLGPKSSAFATQVYRPSVKFLGCYNGLLQTRCLRTVKMYPPSSRSQKSKSCHVSYLTLQAHGKSFPCSFIQVLCGQLWLLHLDLYPLVFTCLLSSVSPLWLSLMRALGVGVGSSHLKSFNLITSAKITFTNKIRFTDSRIWQDGHILRGGHHSTH